MFALEAGMLTSTKVAVRGLCKSRKREVALVYEIGVGPG